MVVKALEDLEKFSTQPKAKPAEIEETNGIAYNSIILHILDNNVRQVDDSKNTRDLWNVLDALFLTKTHKQDLSVGKLLNCKMDLGKD